MYSSMKTIIEESSKFHDFFSKLKVDPNAHLGIQGDPSVK